MKFHVVRNTKTGHFLGKELEEGFRYSTYTDEGASLVEYWDELQHHLDRRDQCLVIFENEESAKRYILNDGDCRLIEYLEAVALSSLETE